MSPTSKPSSVAGLRRGVAGPPAAAAPTAAVPAPKPGQAKPVRVTLNFPPELFRQLDGWAREAADTIGAPRVGVQDAVRAMIRVITGDEAPSCSARVLAELRTNRQD